MNNQTNKIDQKDKAITSFTIGIIGIILSLLSPYTWPGFFEKIIMPGALPIFLAWILLFLWRYGFILIFFLSLFGIFLGIKVMKSSKKMIAILGLVLCVIELIFSLFSGYQLLFG